MPRGSYYQLSTLKRFKLYLKLLSSDACNARFHPLKHACNLYAWRKTKDEDEWQAKKTGNFSVFLIFKSEKFSICASVVRHINSDCGLSF